MLGILDDIEAKRAEPTEQLCKYAALLRTMTPEEQNALDLVHSEIESGRKSNFTVAWLWETLRHNNYSIGKTVISEHIRGECACE